MGKSHKIGYMIHNLLDMPKTHELMENMMEHTEIVLMDQRNCKSQIMVMSLVTG